MKMENLEADQAIEAGQAIDVFDGPEIDVSPAQGPIITNTSAVRRFISDMPMEVQRSFSSEQLKELSKALTRRYYQGPFINYHKSLLGFFLTVYAGREKRSQRRLQIDRLKHQNISLGNVVFMAGSLLAVGSITHLIYTLVS